MYGTGTEALFTLTYNFTICTVSKGSALSAIVGPGTSAWTHGPTKASYSASLPPGYAPLGMNVLCATQTCASLNGAGACTAASSAVTASAHLAAPWYVAEVIVWNVSLSLGQMQTVATSYALPRYGLLAAPQPVGAFAVSSPSGCLVPAVPPSSSCGGAVVAAPWACSDPAGVFSWTGTSLVHAQSGLCVGASMQMCACDVDPGNWTWAAKGTIWSANGTCASVGAASSQCYAGSGVATPVYSTSVVISSMWFTPEYTFNYLDWSYYSTANGNTMGVGGGYYHGTTRTIADGMSFGGTYYEFTSPAPGGNGAVASYTINTDACQTVLLGSSDSRATWHVVDNRTTADFKHASGCPAGGNLTVTSIAAYGVHRLVIVTGDGSGLAVHVYSLSVTWALALAPPPLPSLPPPPLPQPPPYPPPSPPSPPTYARVLYTFSPDSSIASVPFGTATMANGMYVWTLNSSVTLTVLAAGAGSTAGGGGIVVAGAIQFLVGQVVVISLGAAGTGENETMRMSCFSLELTDIRWRLSLRIGFG